MVTIVKAILRMQAMLCFLLTNAMLFDLDPCKVEQQHSFNEVGHIYWIICAFQIGVAFVPIYQ